MNNKEIWVLAEHRDGQLLEITYEMLREGKKLADKLFGRLCMVLLGNGVEKMTTSLGQYGVNRIYLGEDVLLEKYSTDAYASVLYELTKKYDPFVIMIGATPYGNDLAPYLAARLRSGLLPGCVQLRTNDEGNLEGVRPVYGGKVYSNACITVYPAIVTIRPGVIGVDKPKNGPQPEIIKAQLNIEASHIRTRIIGFQKADPASVDITEAEIIVAGGRGMGSAENWSLIEELARTISGSVGGSRVAMDEGWVLRERMVGQTGRTVRPRCYLAVGISGASAHVNGIKDSDLVIAINKDRTAPIFKVADMGIVGDANEILPAIIKKIEAAQAENTNPTIKGGAR